MEKAVGKNRKLTNYKEPCEILEILIKPTFSMKWDWDKGICPHCKKKIIETKNHTFKRIEILIPKSKKNNTLMQQRFHIIGIGFDMNNKTLFIPNKEIQKLLSQIKIFEKINSKYRND